MGIAAAVGLTALYLTGVAVAASALPFRRRIDWILATAAASFAAMVVLMEVLGSFRRLTATGLTAAALLVLVSSLAVRIRSGSRIREQESDRDLPWIAQPVAVLAAATAWLSLQFLAYAVATPVQPVSDAPIYHLPFAIRWWKTASLDWTPAPFGELAATYFPANGDLWIAWLMILEGGGVLAKAAQWPFAVLGAAALYGCARSSRAGRAASLLPAVCWSATPLTLLTSSLAVVDVIFSAFCFLALHFLLRIRADGIRSLELVMLGLSAGVALGTKNIGCVFVPLLLVPAVVSCMKSDKRGKRLLLLAVSVSLPSGYWFLRNALATGNPLYPLHFAPLGVPLLKGWYTSEIMRRTSGYHASPTDRMTFERVFGPIMQIGMWTFWSSLVCWGVVAATIGRRGSGLRLAGLAGCFAAAFALLHWFVIPYNTQQRFILPALGMGFLPVAWLTGKSHWSGAAVAVLLPLMAYLPAWPSAKFSLAVQGAIAAGCLISAELFVLQRIRWSAIAGLAVVLCVLVLSVREIPSGTRAAFYPRGGFAESLFPAWMTLENAAGQEGATVAYAGTNLPYYLYGTGFRNRVCYINVAGESQWLPHEFHMKRLSQGERSLSPTAWPEWHRDGADYNLWLANLRKAGVKFIFAARENLHGRLNLPEGPAPFTIEYEWMQSHPETFRLLGPQQQAGSVPWAYVFELLDLNSTGRR